MKVPHSVWKKHNSRDPKTVQNYEDHQDTFVSLGFELMMEEPGNAYSCDKMLNEIWAHPSGWFIHVLTDKKLIIKIDLFGLEYNLFEKLSAAVKEKRNQMIFSRLLDLIWLKDISLIMGRYYQLTNELDPDNYLSFLKESHNISKMVPLKKIDEEMFLEMFSSWLDMKSSVDDRMFFVNSNLQFTHDFKSQNSDLLIACLFSRDNTIELDKGALVHQNFKHRNNRFFWNDVASFMRKSHKNKKCLKTQERKQIKKFVETIYNAEPISKWIPKIHKKTLGINNLRLLWLYLVGNTNNILNESNQFFELCEMLSESSAQKLLNNTLFDKHCSDSCSDGVSFMFTTILLCDRHVINGETSEAPLSIFLRLMEKSNIRQWSWIDERMDFGGLLVEMIQCRCAIFNPLLVDVLEKLEKEKIWSINQPIKIPPNYIKIHFRKVEMPEDLLDFSNKAWKDLGEWLYLMGREDAEKHREHELPRLDCSPLFVYLTNKIKHQMLLNKVKRVKETESTAKQIEGFRF